MYTSTYNRFFTALAFIFSILLATCLAAPTQLQPHNSVVIRRQDSSGVETFVTTQEISTGAGVFTETCTITMTPVTGDNGESLVREETSCSISMGGANSQPPVVETSTSTAPPSSSTTLVVPADSTVTLPSSSISGSVVPSAAPPVISVATSELPASSIPGGSIPAASSPAPSSLSESGTLSSTESPVPSVTPVGAAAQDNAPLNLPGKNLEVLPIGLGVFGGISAVALVIVGVVTWERRKHRRNFRHLKLSESASRA